MSECTLIVKKRIIKESIKLIKIRSFLRSECYKDTVQETNKAAFQHHPLF
jgi:hypothetical protein